MSVEVTDITPLHDPVSLARVMGRKAQTGEFTAGFYILVRPDGTMDFDGCADQRMELVWALEKLKLMLLQDG